MMNLYDAIYCHVSSNGKENLYLLLDHAGFPGLRSQLKATSLKWKSLFDDTSESGAVEAGPIVVLVASGKRLYASNRFLRWACESACCRSAIMMLSSPLNFEVLHTCLTDRLNARLVGGLEVMLRFYDPRVFEALIKNLDESQRNWFLNFASNWWFVNRAGEVLQLSTTYDGESKKQAKLTFTQVQEDALLKESEVDHVLNTLRNNFPELMRATPQIDQYYGVTNIIDSLRNEKEFSLDDAVCRAAELFFHKRSAGTLSGI